MGRFLLMVMLVMQIALSQHAAVHFLEGAHGHPLHDQEQGQDHKSGNDAPCQLCLLSKNFSKTLTSAEPDVFFAGRAIAGNAVLPPPAFVDGAPSPYIARGPPASSA